MGDDSVAGRSPVSGGLVWRVTTPCAALPMSQGVFARIGRAEHATLTELLRSRRGAEQAPPVNVHLGIP